MKWARFKPRHAIASTVMILLMIGQNYRKLEIRKHEPKPYTPATVVHCGRSSDRLGSLSKTVLPICSHHNRLTEGRESGTNYYRRNSCLLLAEYCGCLEPAGRARPRRGRRQFSSWHCTGSCRVPASTNFDNTRKQQQTARVAARIEESNSRSCKSYAVKLEDSRKIW